METNFKIYSITCSGSRSSETKIQSSKHVLNKTKQNKTYNKTQHKYKTKKYLNDLYLSADECGYIHLS